MRNHPLLEMAMTQLDEAKETFNKIRWDAYVGNVIFSLYIPKWRVPEPWPSSIWVKILPRRQGGDDAPNLSQNDIESNSEFKQEPIVATVSRYSSHSRTDRYSPLGPVETWEIGSPTSLIV